MATNYALRVNAPITSTAVAVATNAGTAGAFALGGAVRVWIKATVDTQFRFGGSSVAAPTGSMFFSSGQDYVLDIPPNVTNCRVKLLSGTTVGSLYWAVVA